MKDHRQIPYSVLTRNNVEEKMKKQIDQISDIFLLSKSNATVLLMYLRWDSLRVSERLGDNKEKSLMDSGLTSVPINQDSSSEVSFETNDEFDDDDNDNNDVNNDESNLISTAFCSHKFDTTYWREYLDKNFYSVEKIQITISCPDKGCRAAVGPDTIKKLTVRDQEMYEEYVLRSYLEGNKALMIKQCPAPDCNYAIEFHQDNIDDDVYSLNVVCVCGHIFCWRCRLESHRPVTCNNASDWLCRDSTRFTDESMSLSTLETKTQPCPRCLYPVQKDITLPHFLTCVCRFHFCSRCLKSEEDHKYESRLKRLCDKAETGVLCVDRWEVCRTLQKQARSNLEAFEESNIKKPSNLKEQDIMIIREGLMLVVQCRRVLKWCCVYDYFHTEYENSKKEYLRYMQGNATAALQSYSDTLQEQIQVVFAATSYGEISFFRETISRGTSNIGNYFYHFIKTLEDGLPDIKGDKQHW